MWRVESQRKKKVKKERVIFFWFCIQMKVRHLNIDVAIRCTCRGMIRSIYILAFSFISCFAESALLVTIMLCIVQPEYACGDKNKSADQHFAESALLVIHAVMTLLTA